MKTSETSILGVMVIEEDFHIDNRGMFCTVYERFIPEARCCITSCAFATNNKMGTVRGLHYYNRWERFAQSKIVRCMSGRAFDVVVDMRPYSLTFHKHETFELTVENHLSLFIPPGIAHGYQTLEDNTTMLYLFDQPYNNSFRCGTQYDDGLFHKTYDNAPQFGVRYNDPLINIPWPREVTVISLKDQNWPLIGE